MSDGGWIGDAAFEESVAQPVEIAAVSGAQAVEHHDFIRTALEVFDQMAANESGSACDEDAHGR
jgi:hypothetical protein